MNPRTHSRRRWRSLRAAAFLALAMGSILQGAESTTKAPYEATWESLKTYPVPRWFDDAKLGIFIHWGPQSILGSPWSVYQNPERRYARLKQQFGAAPPEFGYKDVVTMFKAETWDPQAWAELSQKAGARYVLLTGEHHDGFQLGDSDLTDWCADKMGPQRDLIGELGRAVRAKGMRFAPSYHRERHAGMFSQRRFVEKSPPYADIAEEIRRDPKAASLYGPFEYSDAFLSDYVARWKEWERRYQPDFLWIDDIPFFYTDPKSPQVAKYQDACLHLICGYLNTAGQWGKEVYFNNKGQHPNWPEGVGCLERDHLNLDEASPIKWQCPMTLAGSWFYNAGEEQQDSYKTPTELVHLLCDIVSKNGNLLLNVGPRPDGTIPAGAEERLLALGQWLRVNGEAIYGTRPWKVFGEGAGVPARPARPHTVPLRLIEIRYTCKEDVVYAISLRQPTEPLVLRAVRGLPVGQVTLLGCAGEVAWTRTEAGLRVEPPANVLGAHAWVFKIAAKEGDALSRDAQ